MEIGVFERISSGDWDGEAFRCALVDGMMPEFHGSSVVPSIFDHRPGECPHHLESLMEHVAMTIDVAIGLADRFEVHGERRLVLVTAATWHDVGKMVTRAPKDRWVCPACGRSHPADGACRTRGCSGVLEARSVIGYRGHAAAGASAWIWGNIAAREGVRDPVNRHVERMIRWHSDVQERIIGRTGRAEDAMSVLLSWADEVAKVSPPYVEMVQERPMWKFERAYRRATGVEGDPPDAKYAAAAEGSSGDSDRRPGGALRAGGPVHRGG